MTTAEEYRKNMYEIIQSGKDENTKLYYYYAAAIRLFLYRSNRSVLSHRNDEKVKQKILYVTFLMTLFKVDRYDSEERPNVKSFMKMSDEERRKLIIFLIYGSVLKDVEDKRIINQLIRLAEHSMLLMVYLHLNHWDLDKYERFFSSKKRPEYVDARPTKIKQWFEDNHSDFYVDLVSA